MLELYGVLEERYYFLCQNQSDIIFLSTKPTPPPRISTGHCLRTCCSRMAEGVELIEEEQWEIVVSNYLHCHNDYLDKCIGNS